MKDRVNIIRLRRKDVVSVETRKGLVDAAVVKVRRITRGRYAGMREYTLAPMCEHGKTYGFTVKGETILHQPTKSYTLAEIGVAIQRMDDTDAHQQIKKERQKTECRGKSADIIPGDEVKVRYNNASPRWERVVKVNRQNGKVAIARPGTDLDRLLITVLKGRSIKQRSYRWIYPHSIIEVRTPEKAYPNSIDSDLQEKLDEFGWRQVRFGSEFIESSYVVARDKKAARNGVTYECADSRVYYDPDKGVYWRDTGMFD